MVISLRSNGTKTHAWFIYKPLNDEVTIEDFICLIVSYMLTGLLKVDLRAKLFLLKYS